MLPAASLRHNRAGVRASRDTATDQPFRDELRARLVAAKASTPLFDSPTFARDLERLYLDLADEVRP